MNPALVEILGYPDRDALLAVDVESLFVEPEQRHAAMGRIEQQGALRGHQFRLRRHDGSIIEVVENARAVRDHHGAIIEYEGSPEDVTEQWQSEAALRRTTEALRRTDEERRRLRTEPPRDIRTIAYRIAQEAINITRKRGGAARITVTLEEEDSGLKLSIHDDASVEAAPGAQWDPRIVERAADLDAATMQERAELAGGWCVTRRDVAGTTVQLWLPVAGLRTTGSAPL